MQHQLCFRSSRAEHGQTGGISDKSQARSGAPGHGQRQGLQHFVVIPSGLLEDRSKLAQQLLNPLPARECCRGTQLTGNAGYGQDQKLRVHLTLLQQPQDHRTDRLRGGFYLRLELRLLGLIPCHQRTPFPDPDYTARSFTSAEG